MGLADWQSGAPSAGNSLLAAGSGSTRAPPQRDNRRRVLSIATHPGAVYGTDVWAALAGLRLLAEDRAYLHGVLAALQLRDQEAHALLVGYRERWQQASQRCSNPNGADNAGRRGANIWIQQGAMGVLSWEES